MVRTFEHSGNADPPADTRKPADSQAPAEVLSPINGDAAHGDRRRPGRIETVSPALLPLLRQDRLLEDTADQKDDDDLTAARGIGISVVIGVLLWGGIALLAFSLFAG